MIKIKDESGAVITGMFKDTLGNIIIKDDYAYNKYKQELIKHEELVSLKHEVSYLKEQMDKLLAKLGA